MALNDPLANVLSHILNSERKAKSECIVRPNSKTIRDVLTIMRDQGYISEFKSVEDGKGGFIRIILLGVINRCGVIKPRFSVTKEEYEKFEKRYLPAKGFGILIVSTNEGIMDHNKALTKGLGGRLFAFVY